MIFSNKNFLTEVGSWRLSINCSYFGPDVWQHSMNWRKEIFVSDMWEFGGYSNFAIENSFSHSQNWSHHI